MWHRRRGYHIPTAPHASVCANAGKEVSGSAWAGCGPPPAAGNLIHIIASYVQSPPPLAAADAPALVPHIVLPMHSGWTRSHADHTA